MVLTAFGIEPEAPAGTVVMWADPLSEIPEGWVLCDGNNGTVNMLGKFPRHTNTEAEVGDTGGQNSFQLSSSQLPAHNHSFSTNSEGNHTHRLEVHSFNLGGGSKAYELGGGSPRTSVSGAHSHSVSIGNTGGGSSIENRPGYYEVAFIKKL